MVFKSRRSSKRHSMPALAGKGKDEDDMTENTSYSDLSLSSLSMTSGDAPTKNERRSHKFNTKRTSLLNSTKNKSSPPLTEGRPRPGVTRQNSFRPNDSIAFNDLEGLDALDLSVSSFAVHASKERVTREDDEDQPTENEPQKTGRIKKSKSGLSLTNFVEARVTTFVRNIETIGLILIGEA